MRTKTTIIALLFILLALPAVAQENEEAEVEPTVTLESLFGTASAEFDPTYWLPESDNSAVLVTDESLQRPEDVSARDFERPTVQEAQARLSTALYGPSRFGNLGLNPEPGLEELAQALAEQTADDDEEAPTVELEAVGDEYEAAVFRYSDSDDVQHERYVVQLDALVFVGWHLEYPDEATNADETLAQLFTIIENVAWDATYSAGSAAPQPGVYSGGDAQHSLSFVISDSGDELHDLRLVYTLGLNTCRITLSEPLTVAPNQLVAVFNEQNFAFVAGGQLANPGILVAFAGDSAQVTLRYSIMCNNFIFSDGGDPVFEVTLQD